jgi:hypothetical protein
MSLRHTRTPEAHYPPIGANQNQPGDYLAEPLHEDHVNRPRLVEQRRLKWHRGEHPKAPERTFKIPVLVGYPKHLAGDVSCIQIRRRPWRGPHPELPRRAGPAGRMMISN